MFNEEITRAQEVSKIIEDREENDAVIEAESNTEIAEVKSEEIEITAEETEAAQSGNENDTAAAAENKNKQEDKVEEAS